MDMTDKRKREIIKRIEEQFKGYPADVEVLQFGSDTYLLAKRLEEGGVVNLTPGYDLATLDAVVRSFFNHDTMLEHLNRKGLW